MAAPATVVFDLDNTLYPFEPCHRAGLAEAADLAEARGLKGGEAFAAAYRAARSVLHQRLGDSAASHNRLLYMQGLIEAAWGRLDPGLALDLHEAYWEGYCRAMAACLDPQALPLLARLRGAGTKLGLVTDMCADIQFRKLERLGLGSAFDALVTSEECGADKPDPRGLELCLAKLGRGPEGARFVGDSPERDGGVARALGLSFIWKRAPGESWPAGLAAPEMIVDDMGILARAWGSS